MSETIREKAMRIITRDEMNKLAQEGLLIIDRQDYDITTQGYNEMRSEVKALKLQVKQLQAREGKR